MKRFSLFRCVLCILLCVVIFPSPAMIAKAQEKEESMNQSPNIAMVPLFNMTVSDFRWKLSIFFDMLQSYHDFDEFPYQTCTSFPLRPDFDLTSETSLVDLLKSAHNNIPVPANADDYTYYYVLDDNAVYTDSDDIYSILTFGAEECDYIVYSYQKNNENYQYVLYFDWNIGSCFYSWKYNATNDVLILDIGTTEEDQYYYIEYNDYGRTINRANSQIYN